MERLGIPKLMLSDGPHGLRPQPGEVTDHVGVGDSTPATAYPTAAAVASTWNPELLHRIGRALGQEARAAGISVVLGPGINMKRSPLGGRNFEYYSEDPFLAGEMARGMVDGVQERGIGTSLKHYVANNQETERLRIDVQIDERTLREIYLPAFERVIGASQPWTVMCSYNKVNGTSVSQNHYLLTKVLREEFGFEGVVVSDWGAVYDPVAALQAGTDLEMPPTQGRSAQAIIIAVQNGEVPMSILDERVRRVLELVSRGMHVLELDESYSSEEHHALAREAAAESIVLLKNEDLLPLATMRSVGVIGEFARSPRYQGAGSSQVHATQVEIMVEELEAVMGDVAFAPGYTLDGCSSELLMHEAVELARTVDTAVVVLGLPGSFESEGFDRQHMRLPADQIALLRRVAEANPDVVVVLVNGSAVELDEVTPHANALVEAWLGGQAAGGAIADVLTGKVNPSGRLAETFPVRLEDNSSYLNFPGEDLIVRYGEGVFIGYRGYDAASQDVAFPFGFGLSYTTFQMSDLRVQLSGAVEDGTLNAAITVTVTNTGDLDGAEVVQIYVGDPDASVARPPRELKGFQKVFLPAGASKDVSIRLDQRAFSYWSQRCARWVVEAGEFTIEAGNHSRNLPLVQTVTVTAPPLAEPLTPTSTLGEWLTDPLGRSLIEREVADGQPGTILDPEVGEVLASMPLVTLSTFTGVSLDFDSVHRVHDAWKERTSRS
ncbi:beta-glucosidase [Arthrobacter sp. RAF14]|uniref:beta-glucosidase family protein n=1 Tax=Arthrobacter sp. RAF14 TaxID=3233051 RepID=UPI003F9259CF